MARLSRSEFDRLDRLVRSTDPDPDGDGSLPSHATLYVYDAAGQLIFKNNGANLVAGAHEIDRYVYDPQGRLIRSEDGRGDVTTRGYDDAGNLTKLVDPAGNATHYVYDNLDRMLAEITAAGTRTFIYDVNGNLAISVNRNGKATKQAYLRDDQVYATWEYETLEAAQTAGSQAFIAFTNNYYDALGRLEEERYTRRNGYTNATTLDYRATDSYRYDGLDRLVERSNQSIQLVSPQHSSGPAAKQTYAYAYDSAGLVVTRRQFIGGLFAAETRSHYNQFSELARQVDVEIALGGDFSTILDFEATDAVFSYWEDGSVKQAIRYTDWDGTILHSGHRNQVQTDYAYDGAGRLQQIAHSQARRAAAANPWPANSPLVAFNYEYDAVGRISEIATDWNTGRVGLTTRVDATQAYAFDAAGQLVSGGAESFAYGPNGNRTTAVESSVGGNSYTTVAGNQVEQDSYWTYQYDNEGNLIRRDSILGDDFNIYSWDDRNRLVKIERRDSTGLLETIAYRYNSADQLIYRSITLAGQAAQAEYYLIDGGRRALTYEADNDVKRRYQYGPTGEVLFEQTFNAAGNQTFQAETDLLLPLGDHQHTTWLALAHATDDSIYVRQSYDVSSFGRDVSTLGADGLPDNSGRVVTHGYQGMVYDVQAGHYRTDARVYDPHLGRFISEDPIQDGANWYMFAGNDPVNYADPSGLSLQGYPLGGGYSGNVPRAPTVPMGKPSAVLAPRFPSTIGEFNKQLSANSNFAALTKPLPLDHSVNSSVVNAELWKAAQRQPRTRIPRPVFESPTAAFFGSLWEDTKELSSTVAEGLWAVATSSEARAAFSEAWHRERVQPMADRLYSLSKAYGHTDEAIGDQNSFALFRATIGEILPINVTAQALEGRDLGTGRRTSDLQREQDAFNAASGWLLFSAGTYSTGQQVRFQFSNKPGTGFVLGETSELNYPLGTPEEQIAAFRAEQTINRGYLLEAPASPPTPSAPKSSGPRPGAVKENPGNQLMETGIPLKGGVGWVKRWTRATPEEVDAQNRAIFAHYEKVEMYSRNLPPELQHNFRFEEMQRFRTQYREQFLKNRGR